MIQNKLFTVSILTAVTSAACFFGCSSDNTGSGTPGSSSGGPIQTGSSGGTGNPSGSSSGVNQAGGPSGDGGACTPASVQTSNLPPYTPVMEMIGACTSTQISGFLSACIGSGSSANNCSMWANANGSCAGCIVQGSDAGATQTGAIIFTGSGAPLSGNVPGCIALVDANAGPQCATQLEPLMQCLALACGSCSDQTSFSNCEAASKANGGPCGSLAASAESPCSSYLGSNGLGVTKCGYNTSNQLTDVINVVCGSGP